MKALLITYIYGVVYPIDEIANLCFKNNIEICEDVAEAYLGNSFTGSKRAAISMFSFGQIKRCTAFAGSICFIREPQLYEKMDKINENFRAQDKKAYFKKILKFSIPFVVINNKPANFLFCEVFRMLNLDLKEIIISKLRGFQPSSNYLSKFEYKPCTPNLRFLLHRLNTFDEKDYKEKIMKLETAVEFFISNNLICPGYKFKERGFW